MKRPTYWQYCLVSLLSVTLLLWLGGCQNRNAFQFVRDGDALYRQGYNDRAIAEYSKAIEENPQFTAAYINRGVAYWRKAEYERSILDCNQVLKIDPNNARAFANLAASQYHMRKYPEALANTKKALELDSNLTFARFNLGLIYATTGDWESAKTAYEGALKTRNNRNDEGDIEQVQLALKLYPQSVPLMKALELLKSASPH